MHRRMESVDDVGLAKKRVYWGWVNLSRRDLFSMLQTHDQIDPLIKSEMNTPWKICPLALTFDVFRQTK